MAEFMEAVEITEGKKCADVEKIAKTSFGSVLMGSLTAKPILINIHMLSEAKFEFWLKCGNYIKSSFTVGYYENHYNQLDTVVDIVKSKITVNIYSNIPMFSLLKGKLSQKYEAGRKCKI